MERKAVAQVALGEVQVDGLAREAAGRLGQELVDGCDVHDVLVELVPEAIGAQKAVEDVVPRSVHHLEGDEPLTPGLTTTFRPLMSAKRRKMSCRSPFLKSRLMGAPAYPRSVDHEPHHLHLVVGQGSPEVPRRLGPADPRSGVLAVGDVDPELNLSPGLLPALRTGHGTAHGQDRGAASPPRRPRAPSSPSRRPQPFPGHPPPLARAAPSRTRASAWSDRGAAGSAAIVVKIVIAVAEWPRSASTLAWVIWSRQGIRLARCFHDRGPVPRPSPPLVCIPSCPSPFRRAQRRRGLGRTYGAPARDESWAGHSGSRASR